LQQPKKQAEFVYFVDSGIVSLRIVSAGAILETAVVGYRGAVGASSLFGGHLTHQSIVLVPGKAWRIHVDDLGYVTNERPQVREHLLQHVQALGVHCAQTGLCGVRHELEHRLACWLCLACDALDGRILPVTHDYFSAFLGLRRASVTQALTRFEEQGLIRKMRGVVEINERKSLERKACRCYDIISSAHTSAERPTYMEQPAELAVSQARLLVQKEQQPWPISTNR
jgi:CRP-like cAMP-binding protein